jgi:hypothetical protein
VVALKKAEIIESLSEDNIARELFGALEQERWDHRPSTRPDARMRSSAPAHRRRGPTIALGHLRSR